MAILISFIRFTSNELHKKCLLSAAATFIVFCGVLVGQVFWTCPEAYKFGCTRECAKQFAILQLVSKCSTAIMQNR